MCGDAKFQVRIYLAGCSAGIHTPRARERGIRYSFLSSRVYFSYYTARSARFKYSARGEKEDREDIVDQGRRGFGSVIKSLIDWGIMYTYVRACLNVVGEGFVAIERCKRLNYISRVG